MPFRQDDVVEELQVCRETWRNWRTHVPRLKDRKGGKARFTSGEMLALKVIAYLVRRQHMPLEKLGPRSSDIFAACRFSQWDRIRKRVFI